VFSDDKVKGIKMGRACGIHGHNRGVNRVWVGKPEVKGPLGRPNGRWEDTIKIDIQKIG
jgi:hypothetical protein